MKKAVNVVSYISIGFIILSVSLQYNTSFGYAAFALLGYLGFIFCIVSTTILKIINKSINFFRVIHQMSLLTMVITLFYKYLHWSFWDVPGFYIITVFIILSVIYFLKEHKSDKFFSFNKLTTLLFLALIIPMLFTFKNGPRTYIPEDWQKPSKDNANYRNGNWAWIENGDFGEGQWVPIAKDNTVENGDYTLFFSNSKIRETGRMKDFKQVDTTIFYNIYEQPILYDIHLQDSIYKYFINEGKFISYYVNCKIFEIGIVKNHIATNNWISYFESGKIKYKLINKNNITTKRQYFETGQMEHIISLKNNKEDGVTKKWYNNGKLEYLTTWKEGIQNGVAKTWFENGQLATLINWRDGIQVGLFLNYTEYGVLLDSLNWFEGVSHGAQVQYYDNSLMKQKANYVNGKLEGFAQTWFENGQLEAECNYIDDLKDGRLIQYYQNGQLETEQFYKKGLRDGKFLFYYENGILQAEQNYKNNIINGDSKFYDKDGNLEQIDRYKNGTPTIIFEAKPEK